MCGCILMLGLAETALPASLPELMPPSFDGIVRISCNATRSVLPDKTSWWHTHVFVEYARETFTKLSSIRYGNERKKALADCDRWMAEMFKQASEHEKAKKLASNAQ